MMAYGTSGRSSDLTMACQVPSDSPNNRTLYAAFHASAGETAARPNKQTEATSNFMTSSIRFTAQLALMTSCSPA
ncbi:hypothetical protein ACVWZK_000168 [Bradyrhizobium sp. GM0.4]